jgi:hypothetical protein
MNSSLTKIEKENINKFVVQTNQEQVRLLNSAMRLNQQMKLMQTSYNKREIKEKEINIHVCLFVA